MTSCLYQPEGIIFYLAAVVIFCIIYITRQIGLQVKMFDSKFYSAGAIADTPSLEVKEVENQPRLNQY